MSDLCSFKDQAGNLLAYKRDDAVRLYDHEYSELAICLLIDWLCREVQHYPAPPDNVEGPKPRSPLTGRKGHE